MRTLFAKILLWFWCTVAITVVGSAFISALSMSRNASDAGSPVARMVRFQMEEARVAYETGGRPALQSFLENVRKIYHAQGILTDEHGRDLASGADCADLVRRARLRRPFQFFRTGAETVARAADDGRYWFFFIVPGESPGSWFLTPDHLFIMAVAVLLCYWLAMEVTKPVRELQKAVERFGRGASRRCSPPSAACSSISPTNCVRPSRVSAWRWSWRGPATIPKRRSTASRRSRTG
jgi:two-component system sensor histidine kinase CpxA